MTLAQAETVRVASFDAELSRKGPGLMLRDIVRGEDQVQAVSAVVAHIRPDILFLQGVDYDHNLHGLGALRDALATAGVRYEHMFAMPPNAGDPTELDLNGDGRTHGHADAQGYGRFFGDGGMALLSRWPILQGEAQDFTQLLWRDLPGARLPIWNNAPYPSKEAQQIQRLSSVGHWVVPVISPQGRRMSLMLFAAGPPVFDGPEDRNGFRNADEIRLFQLVLDGSLGQPPDGAFVIMGNANLDPEKGEGQRKAIHDLLSDPRVQDPHNGMGPTVDWKDPLPGDLRVDYVLPSVDLNVRRAGVFWPKENTPDHALLSFKGTPASRHRMVWADLEF